MKEIRNQARTMMEGFCRVCPVCDGRVCAGQVPGMGGIGTGAAFRDNVQALSECRFNMRVIHDVVEPDTRADILGIPLEIPVLSAPIGGVSFNMGGKISEEDYISTKLEGCREKGIIGCTGDGAPAFIHEAGFQAIRSLKGHGIPFIKPWEDRELFGKLEGAAAAGAAVVGMDIDAAGLITLKLMGRPVSPKTPEKLKEIISRTPMKFILKGIMTPGVARILSGVASAVKGQIVVLADGGVRTGGDVLKMLALGADAVMIGRPFSVAVMGGLKEGAMRYIDQIRSELIQAMILTGSKSVGAVEPSILWMKP